MNTLYLLLLPRYLIGESKRGIISDTGYAGIYAAIFFFAAAIQRRTFSSADVLQLESAGFAILLGLVVFLAGLTFAGVARACGTRMTFAQVEKPAHMISFLLLWTLALVLSYRIVFGSYDQIFATLDMHYETINGTPDERTIFNLILIGMLPPGIYITIVALARARKFEAWLTVAYGLAVSFALLFYFILRPGGLIR
jgi:hypothetical protein